MWVQHRQLYDQTTETEDEKESIRNNHKDTYH